MASRFSLLVTLLGVLIPQNVNTAELKLPYNPSIYRQMLSGAPWYSYCDLPWLSFYEPGYYEKFSRIAEQYNIRISDIYQYHTIIDQSLPNLSYAEESNILQAIAAELRKELNRTGIWYLPTPPSCSNLYDVSPQNPDNPIPTIAKRSPDMIPDNYVLPTTYPYSTDINTSSFDFSLAYKNLYVMLDQYMPDLPRSVYNNIKNTILNNTPPQYEHLADDVANQLTTNIRYTIGMAEQKVPSFYYY